MKPSFSPTRGALIFIQVVEASFFEEETVSYDTGEFLFLPNARDTVDYPVRLPHMLVAEHSSR